MCNDQSANKEEANQPSSQNPEVGDKALPSLMMVMSSKDEELAVLVITALGRQGKSRDLPHMEYATPTMFMDLKALEGIKNKPKAEK